MAEASESSLVEDAITRPPRSRKTGGWADESPAVKGKKRRDQVEEDERLKQHDDSDEELPIIPDLEDFEDEDLTAQVAAPPSVAVNRVATYKELDSDLHKHAGLFTMDGDIDLKILASVLSPELEITEADNTWEWNRLFAEVSPDIQDVWDRFKGRTFNSQSPPGGSP